MPVPMILGLPFLASLLGGAFASLISFFGNFLTKRLALFAAMLTLLIAVTGTFILAIEGLISAVSYTLPSEYFNLIGLFLPSNFTACFSTIVTAKLLRWAYDWNVVLIQSKMSI